MNNHSSNLFSVRRCPLFHQIRFWRVLLHARIWLRLRTWRRAPATLSATKSSTVRNNHSSQPDQQLQQRSSDLRGDSLVIMFHVVRPEKCTSQRAVPAFLVPELAMSSKNNCRAAICRFIQRMGQDGQFGAIDSKAHHQLHCIRSEQQQSVDNGDYFYCSAKARQTHLIPKHGGQFEEAFRWSIESAKANATL